ncbi:MAG: N-acetylmuramic acid 6-phosphate etherase [Blastocatellia bacterium]
MKRMLPVTEQENPRTQSIDSLPTIEAVRLINDEDKTVAFAIERILPQIAAAIDSISERMKAGGRLFYVGTGTSGRLGVLDAAEIPPTYGLEPERVRGIIAGGYSALYQATEASEDDREAGARDLREAGLSPVDSVVGLAASGRTPYTIGAVEYARSIGCFTAAIVCTPDSDLARASEIAIEAIVGPEVITGSTRMKAGTAQKMILNMISTGSMIRLGYVKGNRMTNLRSANQKLKERSLRILMTECGIDEPAAKRLFAVAGEDLRTAIVMAKTGASAADAAAALASTNFIIEQAIELLPK